MAKALIVVDVQRDFCPGGALAVPGGDVVASRITQWLTAGAEHYDVVVATMDWHPSADQAPSFPHFADEPDFSTTWRPHCVQSTVGAHLHPNLDLPSATVYVRKGQLDAAYSGFEGSDMSGASLAEILRRAGVDEVDVVGLATDYCVKATALDARALGFRVRVLTGLVAGVAPDTTRAAVEAMRAAGVEISNAAVELEPREREGHRTVAHTADVIVEAWAGDLASCVRSAVRGIVSTFLDTRFAEVTERRLVHLPPASAESLLMSVLDEVLFLLDTESSVPIDAEIAPARDGGLDVVVLLAGRDTVTAIGSVPKGISRSEPVTTQVADQVRCQFIVDV